MLFQKTVLATLALVAFSPLSNAVLLESPQANYQEVAMGRWHVCFLRPTELRCRGSNSYGEAPRGVPFQNAKLVATNPSHTCVADDEGVWCYGRKDEIKNVPLGLKNITSLALGKGFACAVSDGKVKCWGEKDELPIVNNRPGKIIKIDARYERFCRLYTDALVCSVRSEFTETIDNPLDLAVGESHSCVLTKGKEDEPNQVQCFGYNSDGQLDVPQLDRPTALVAGRRTTCAKVYTGYQCWGKRDDYVHDASHLEIDDLSICGIRRGKAFCTGHLGENIQRPLVNPESIMTVGYHNCAKDSGELVCWGDNWSDVIPSVKVTKSGFGLWHHVWIENNNVQSLGGKPEDQPPPLSNPKYVAVGGGASCAIDDTGVVCWGKQVNRYGGNKNYEIEDPKFVAIARDAICAASTTELKCWTNSRTLGKEASIANPTQLIAGDNNFCLIDDNGLSCWASTYPFSSETTKPPAMEDVQTACIGSSFACAIHGDHQVSCWGYRKELSTLIPILDKPTDIGCGHEHACVLDGKKILCWGRDQYGQATPPDSQQNFSLR